MPRLRSRPGNESHQNEASRSRFAFSIQSLKYQKMNLTEGDIPGASLNGRLPASFSCSSSPGRERKRSIMHSVYGLNSAQWNFH